MCTSHKLVAGYTRIRYAHVHMSKISLLGLATMALVARVHHLLAG